MLKQAILVKRPDDVPAELRIVRTELVAMEYAGTPHGRTVTDGWQLVVFADPQKITEVHRVALKAAGWARFPGRNAGTFRKKITVRFES